MGNATRWFTDWNADYDPEPPDRPDPSEYDDREPPDEDEPEDNVPDAVADRLTWDAEVIAYAEDLLDREGYSRDYAEEEYMGELLRGVSGFL